MMQTAAWAESEQSVLGGSCLSLRVEGLCLKKTKVCVCVCVFTRILGDLENWTEFVTSYSGGKDITVSYV